LLDKKTLQLLEIKLHQTDFLQVRLPMKAVKAPRHWEAPISSIGFIYYVYHHK